MPGSAPRRAKITQNIDAEYGSRRAWSGSGNSPTPSPANITTSDVLSRAGASEPKRMIAAKPATTSPMPIRMNRIL